MGFFSNLFKSKPSSVENDNAKFEHPELGTFYIESEGDWLQEDASIPGLGKEISLYLFGDKNGPSAQAISDYQWLIEDTSRIWDLVKDEIFELYQNYTDQEVIVNKCANADATIKTAEVSLLSIKNKDDFYMTMTFSWQKPNDGHITTFYIEDGKSQGNSVDG